MAVQAQIGGFAGCVPPLAGSVAEEHIWAVKDYGAGAPQFAAANNGYQCPGVVSGAQSELTCNGNGAVVLLPSRKRGREEAGDIKRYVTSAAALLPIPAMQKASRAMDSATTTSVAGGREEQTAQEHGLVSELCRQGAEIDALVRAECERLRAGLELARKRQCQELARVVAGAAARGLREKEAELAAARRRAAELEARVRQAAAESQAWRGLARGHEAVAAELRAALDHHHLLLRTGAAGAAAAVEGFGDSEAAEDAQSSCRVEAKDVAPNKWACKACGEREASVLLLPCRHLCLCKACEPRLDSCPVCLAVKNAAIHVAPS